MGIFDGHGLNGHLMSSFVMGAMVDFIENSKQFNQTEHLDQMTDEEMTRAIRKCFRYAQNRAKKLFKEYMVHKDLEKKKEDLRKFNQSLNEKEREEEEQHLKGEIDEDVQEFIENYSWDTESDEGDIELDN
jgi:serine/threonine protein phosphatase PrpC